MSDVARLTEELVVLDGERAELDRRLREADLRSLHGRDAEEKAKAKAEAAALVVAMDDLMTRIRVVEGKLQFARQGRKLPWA